MKNNNLDGIHCNRLGETNDIYKDIIFFKWKVWGVRPEEFK